MKPKFATRLIVGLLSGFLLGIGVCGVTFHGSAEAASSQQTASLSATPTPEMDPRKLFAKGEAALQSGDLNTAEAAFSRVLASDPQVAGAYANLGVIAMRCKDWDPALSLLEKAARLAPKVSGICLNISLVDYRRSDYAAAIPPLFSLLQDQPDSLQARYLLALCYLFLNHEGGWA
jgi:tetratricopeptide (TPR) repeat protein